MASGETILDVSADQAPLCVVEWLSDEAQLVGKSADAGGLLVCGSAALVVFRVIVVGLEVAITDFPEFVEHRFEVGFDHDPAHPDAVGDVVAGYGVCDVGVGCDTLEPRV